MDRKTIQYKRLPTSINCNLFPSVFCKYGILKLNKLSKFEIAKFMYKYTKNRSA